MGYTIKIGEYFLDDSDSECSLDSAKPVELPEAPAFGEPTDRKNERWPGYSSWTDFCQTMGLTAVMWDGVQRPEGYALAPLMPSHPGVAVITEKHLEFVKSRVKLYKARNPGHIAQYRPLKPGVEDKGILRNRVDDYDQDPKYDGSLCRAEWLVFWMEWALENCDRPVFANS